MDKKTDWTPFDWSKVPSYTKDGKMIIDNADIFERVIRKIQDETGATQQKLWMRSTTMTNISLYQKLLMKFTRGSLDEDQQSSYGQTT